MRVGRRGGCWVLVCEIERVHRGLWACSSFCFFFAHMLRCFGKEGFSCIITSRGLKKASNGLGRRARALTLALCCYLSSAVSPRQEAPAREPAHAQHNIGRDRGCPLSPPPASPISHVSRADTRRARSPTQHLQLCVAAGLPATKPKKQVK